MWLACHGLGPVTARHELSSRTASLARGIVTLDPFGAAKVLLANGISGREIEPLATREGTK